MKIINSKVEIPLVWLIGLFFISCVAEAKDSTYQKRSDHSAFFEVGGNAVIYSFNYEYKLKELKNSYLVQSIGMQVPILDDPKQYWVGGATVIKRRLNFAFFPLRLAWISHKNSNHHLEAGLGATYFTESDLPSSSISFSDNFGIQLAWGNTVYFSPNLGYRYTGDNGIMARATLSPIVHRFTDPQFQFYGGVSIGYNFKKRKT
jgi:hypothetical protein